VHLTGTASSFNFEKFLNAVNQRFMGLPTVISGAPTQHYRKPIPLTVQFKKSLSEMMEFLSGLSQTQPA
jgi:hypothetical protein